MATPGSSDPPRLAPIASSPSLRSPPAASEPASSPLVSPSTSDPPASPRPSLPATVLSTPAAPPRPPSRTDPPPRAASTTGFAAVFNRSPPTSRPIRRQTTQERLDDILETARQRAESLSAQSLQPGGGARRATFVPMEPLLRNQSAPGAFAGVSEHESSADETTGIVSAARGGGRRSTHGSARQLNYQSIASTTSTYESASASGSRSQSGPRSRRSNIGDGGQNDDDGSSDAGRDRSAGDGKSGRVGEATSTGGGVAGGRTRPAPSNRTSSSAAAGGERWWTGFWAGFRSIELENKGSVARDHLALERTFLAWLRTSLAFASIGVAVTQLFRLNTATSDDGSGNSSNDKLNSLQHVGRPLGTTFLGISILILFMGYNRYYQSQQWIMKGKFPASRGTILVVSLVTFALMVASLVVVVVVHPTHH